MPTSARDVPAETLESDVDPRVRLRRVLLDDVRQHAVAGRKLEAPDDLFEQLLEPNDRVEIVGGGIETDDDVAAAVRRALQNRKQNFLLVVSGTVRLDAGAEMRGAPMVTPWPSSGLKSVRATDESSSFVITLATAAIASLASAAWPLRRPRAPPGPSRSILELRDRQRVEVVVETTVARLLKRRRHAVVDEARTSNVADCRGAAARGGRPHVRGRRWCHPRRDRLP